MSMSILLDQKTKNIFQTPQGTVQQGDEFFGNEVRNKHPFTIVFWIQEKHVLISKIELF